MKLYPVKIVYTTMVAAVNEDFAYSYVKECADIITQDSDPDEIVVQSPIQKEEDIPSDWNGALPYGDNEKEMTCNQIVRMSSKSVFIENLSESQKNKILYKFTPDQLAELLYK
jgi:hypothetical protein